MDQEYMKIWLIYLIDQDEPNIYGYSTNKELVKKFRETRNMKHYKIFKRVITKGEFESISFEYMTAILMEFEGYGKDQNGYPIPFKFVVTQKELNHIRARESFLFETEIFKIVSVNHGMAVKNSYRDSLASLMYFVYNSYLSDKTDLSERMILARTKRNDFEVLMELYKDVIL